MLNLARLQLLRELHSRGTIAAVASALSYSPSTVSRQLSELQREAGVTLFERDGRRLKLTGAAHVLVRHADALLARIEQAEAEMAAVAGTVAGVVRVAAFQTASTNLVAPALGELSSRYPALRVEVVEAEPERALEALALREVDLGLWDEYDYVPHTRPPGVVFEELHVESVRLAVPRDHHRTAVDALALADLADEPWAAGHPGSSHRRLVTHLCDAFGGFAPDVRHQATDLLVLLALVGAGQAVTLLPELARPDRERAVRVLDIAEAPVRRRIYTATRPDSFDRPALTAVHDALLRAARRTTQP
jgi:DNA-binding transcriptional LysR family regulator